MAAEPGKLRWRCRRGMKELDILLTRYLDDRYDTASPGEQHAFQELLDTQDPLIFAYCMGSQRPPEHLVDLIGQIAANPPVTR